MKSIIKEIYFGNRGNFELFKSSEKERNMTGKLDKLYCKIKTLLNDEENEIFEKFCEAYDSLISEETLCHYVEGFKIGILIGIECNEDK